MPPHARPSLSITLPSNFEFHYNDGQLPRTPDHDQEEQIELNPPPPPRPNTFKIRRKRATIVDEFEQVESEPMSDIVIPTIETSEAGSEMSSPMFRPNASEGLLAPLPTFQRFVTPPKTPAPRVQLSFNSPIESPAHEWNYINESSKGLKPAFERSGSVCSSFSDSSVSSCGSSAFSAPNNCTSPDSEGTDPFLEDDCPKDIDQIILSPDQHSSSPTAKRVKTHRHVKWTQAMDDHLWMTYSQYLADPRVTPFKTIPGTSPPLGVCSRVASKARRTWSSRKASTPAFDAAVTREGSPDTIRPEGELKKQPQWPRSDSATRRRLRTLCKRRPSVPTYYQRLLRTRSPSPLLSSSSTTERMSEGPSAVFSSRDMNVSLVAATAPSMQLEGPLAQLSSDGAPTQPSHRGSRPEGWFDRMPRQQMASLRSGLSVNTSAKPAASLASPFDDVTDRTHLLHSMSTTKSLGRTAFDNNVKAPSLDSPVELSGAPTMPRTLKRRFKSDEEKPKRLPIQDVFGPPQADEGGIMRNRGFSVGAVHANQNLAKLFTPPASSSVDHEMTEAPELPSVPNTTNMGPPGLRSAPRRLAEPVPRLGSPFTETPPNRQVNTFPRSYIPTAGNPQPFQQRLRELAAGSLRR